MLLQVGVDVGVVANNGSYAHKLVPENPVMLNRLHIQVRTCTCIHVVLVCGLRY